MDLRRAARRSRRFPGQGGEFERASDAVVAFGPDNVVYANSLVFDLHKGGGMRSGMAVNVSKDGGRTWSEPCYSRTTGSAA